MAATDKRQSAHRVNEAQAGREELAIALKRAGIQLPALGVRVYGPEGEPSHALVDLGRCAAPAARELAAVIVRGCWRE